MRYAARYTNHPAEDLQRNFSACAGEATLEEWHGFFQSEDEIIASYMRYFVGSKWEQLVEEENECALDYLDSAKDQVDNFRFHPAHNALVYVHYNGLGAWELEAETEQEAIEAVQNWLGNMDSNTVNLIMLDDCDGNGGSGCFDARDCEGYIESGIESVYIFILND